MAREGSASSWQRRARENGRLHDCSFKAGLWLQSFLSELKLQQQWRKGPRSFWDQESQPGQEARLELAWTKKKGKGTMQCHGKRNAEAQRRRKSNTEARGFPVRWVDVDEEEQSEHGAPAKDARSPARPPALADDDVQAFTENPVSLFSPNPSLLGSSARRPVFPSG
ncbi:LOW QUALITY PROTEIN: hypothetical protein U9M48_021197 [Paspalum notatum var. saurae]|uniref:Uncharacterized protein n=1 Tax=Paspalum notatum var. saurae TaxID=547442 RepID=A0AAQ3WTC8_PASNO